jgi:hypothetical protein
MLISSKCTGRPAPPCAVLSDDAPRVQLAEAVGALLAPQGAPALAAARAAARAAAAAVARGSQEPIARAVLRALPGS